MLHRKEPYMAGRGAGDGTSQLSSRTSARTSSASEDTLPLIENPDDDMEGRVHKKWGKTFVHRRDPTSTKMTYFLLVILISIPVLSLYIGYTLTINFAGPKVPFNDESLALDSSQLNYSLRFTRYLTADFQGGIGNLMFQFAAVYGLSKANGMIPLIPKETYLNRVFPVLYTELSQFFHPGARYVSFHERYPTSYDPRSFSLNFEKNIQLSGYFQSWKYFEHARKDIREQFVFQKDIQVQAKAFLDQAKAANMPGIDVTYVGIHIRRGDFLSAYNVARGYTVATAEYLERAMAYYAHKYDNVLFIACSDDKDWMRSYMKPSPERQIHYSLHDSDILDLTILTLCNHSVITVGTFGWWAGYLAGGDVVYYGGYPSQGSSLSKTFMPGDYYYPGWVAL